MQGWPRWRRPADSRKAAGAHRAGPRVTDDGGKGLAEMARRLFSEAHAGPIHDAHPHAERLRCERPASYDRRGLAPPREQRAGHYHAPANRVAWLYAREHPGNLGK